MSRCCWTLFWLVATSLLSGCCPPKPAGGVGSDGESFAGVRDALVDAWLEQAPAWGRQVGLHQYDGKIADYSPAGIARHIAWLETARAKLSTFADAKLSADEALDRAVLLGKITLDHFNLSERKLHRSNPRHFGELFNVSAYIDFDYAPLAQRALALVEHEEAALGQVEHIFANLEPTLSKPVVETAIKSFKGYAEYLRGDVKKLLSGKLTDPQQAARFLRSNEALAKAAAAAASRLEKEYLPRADMSSHVLGRERYLRFVAAQEGRPIDLAAFKRMADEDLARNKAAYQQLKAKVNITRPTADKLLSEATRLVQSSRAFVIEKKLVTIPSSDQAVLKETPPYMRWNAAFLNMPGAFDSAKQGYYYITLPDPSWPEKEQTEYIFPYGTLMATTVHEVYPGHFLHGLFIRLAPTRVQKMVDSYSFTEGWAHYTEQLMVEQGYLSEDPQNHLGQLSDALLRNCRFVVSIGVHAEGMTLEQAAKRFVDDCFQDQATAREQAARATFDPGFFAYTVGKLQILELRREAKQKLGARFDLRAFHDALLSHGAPPVALIRERVLRDLGAL